MKHQIPEIIEELYQTYGAQEVQLGYPPRPSDVPHGLWAFYQGFLLGVRLRAAAPTGMFTACPSLLFCSRRPHTP